MGFIYGVFYVAAISDIKNKKKKNIKNKKKKYNKK